MHAQQRPDALLRPVHVDLLGKVAAAEANGAKERALEMMLVAKERNGF